MQRAEGVAMLTTTTRLGNFIVGVSAPPVIESAGFNTHVFLGILCGLARTWAHFFVPEAWDKILAELLCCFGDDIGEE